MSDFGFQVFDAVGDITASSVRLARILDNVSHNASETVTRVINAYNPTDGFFYWIRTGPGGESGRQPDISFNNSNKTLTIVPNGTPGVVLVGMNR